MTHTARTASGLLALGSLLFLSAQASAQGDPQFEFYGDARFRLEFNDNDAGIGVKDRHRQRMRFRLGTNVIFDEEVKIGARLVTGNPDDPNSTHVDIGSGFDDMTVSLDRLFLTYTPASLDGLTVDIGKFPLRMLRNPVYGELAWDADVQPEGLQMEYASGEWGVRFGMFEQLHQSSAEDIWMSYTQIYWSQAKTAPSRFETALAYFFHGDPNPDSGDPFAISRDDPLYGNALSGGQFVSDYGVLNAMAAFHTGDFVFSGELFHNTRAADGLGDSGAAVGAAWKSGDHKLYYQFQAIEQDAVFAPYAQDDFLIATNTRAHVAGWILRLTERMSMRVWVLVSEPEEMLAGFPTDTVYRFRAELNLDF